VGLDFSETETALSACGMPEWDCEILRRGSALKKFAF
jgi:hypothetical protein